MLIEQKLVILSAALLAMSLAACGFERDDLLPAEYFVISSVVGPEGDMTPRTIEVKRNQQVDFVITPNSGFEIANVTGCDGNLTDDNTYTTGRIRADCSVRVRFQANQAAAVNPFATLPAH